MGLDGMITFNDCMRDKKGELKMCEKCENYKPPKVEQVKMECYKNKCAECLCKSCADFNDCDNKKCSYCKFHNTNIWSGGTAQTATWTPNGGYNVL
jgi:hypothetical protein